MCPMASPILRTTPIHRLHTYHSVCHRWCSFVIEKKVFLCPLTFISLMWQSTPHIVTFGQIFVILTDSVLELKWLGPNRFSSSLFFCVCVCFALCVCMTSFQILGYFLTATKRTNSARFLIFSLLTLNFLVERFVNYFVTSLRLDPMYYVGFCHWFRCFVCFGISYILLK